MQKSINDIHFWGAQVGSMYRRQVGMSQKWVSFMDGSLVYIKTDSIRNFTVATHPAVLNFYPDREKEFVWLKSSG